MWLAEHRNAENTGSFNEDLVSVSNRLSQIYSEGVSESIGLEESKLDKWTLCLSHNQLTCKWNSTFCLKFVNVDLDEANPQFLKISKQRYLFDKSVRMSTVWFSGRKINKQSILENLTNSCSYHVSVVAVYSLSFLGAHPCLIHFSPACLLTGIAWVFSLSINLSQLFHNPWSIYRSKMNN